MMRIIAPLAHYHGMGRVLAIAVVGLLAGGMAAAGRPVEASGSDAEIERNIRERFSKSKIAKNNFQVKVRNGVATLEGKTDVIQHKGVATRLAKLGGATSVNNRIVVSEAARQKAGDNLAKGRRRAQAKRAQPTRGEPRSEAPRGEAPRSDNRLAEQTPAPLRRAVVRWPK